MSKNKRNRHLQNAPIADNTQLNETESVDSKKCTDTGKSVDQVSQSESGKNGILTYLRSHLWLVAVICFLTLGTLGAGLKYLDDEAQREIARRYSRKGNFNAPQDQSFVNKINPFLPDPPANPTSTPLPLSKEYIYAGSRPLAVEDANANSAPPADLAIWRPSSGEWWVMGSNGGSQQVTQSWGVNGDKPVPGDYDGDGKTDFAVFRPSVATWYIVNSGGGGGQFAFGAAADIAAPADYDGDGRTDAAVFRPTTGTWYIQQTSNNQTVSQQFGVSSDEPAPADYDGDGKADIAVWRKTATAFYSMNSSNGLVQIPTFGQDGDKVVSGDYDGDGKADYAVFKDSTANWYILQSTNGQQMVGHQWGASGDKTVQNDYDGDGKVDVAVWRNSNGTWYIKNSADNSPRTVQWGAAGDEPAPALYRR